MSILLLEQKKKKEKNLFKFEAENVNENETTSRRVVRWRTSDLRGRNCQ